MPQEKILATHQFASIVIQAAATTEKRERSVLVAKARAAVEILFTAVAKSLGKAEVKKFQSVTKVFERYLDAILNREPQQRRQAANEAIVLYAQIYGLLTAKKDDVKGTVDSLTEETEEAEKEARLCAEPPTDGERVKEQEKEKANLPREVRVEKPGDIWGVETLAISPDFARFLREQQGRTEPAATCGGSPAESNSAGGAIALCGVHLLSQDRFEAWLAKDGKKWRESRDMPKLEEGSDTYDRDLAELYRIALQQAFKQYEDQAYQKLYCKPNNIPMPGIQYGHRMLRLPIYLTRDQFLTKDETGKKAVYAGSARYLQTPDLDFEELVRRYVNALRLTSMTVYNLDDITPDYIARYFRNQIEILDPKKIDIFLSATARAATSALLRDFIRLAQEQGRDLAPEQVGDWLRGSGAASLRNEIKSSWAGAVASVLPGAAPGLLEELEPKGRFEQLFVGLCAPNVGDSLYGPNGAGAAYDSAYKSRPLNQKEFDGAVWRSVAAAKWVIGNIEPISYSEKATREQFKSAVVTRLDLLAALYDKAWRAARDTAGLSALESAGAKFSGYEFKAYASWLAIKALRELNGPNFDGTLTAYSGPNNSGGATKMVAADCLHDAVDKWELLIAESEVDQELRPPPPAQPTPTSWFYSNNANRSDFTAGFNKIVADIVDSYGKIVDILISAAPAGRVGAALSGAPDDVQVQSLYLQWTEVFGAFLRQFSASRGVARDNKIVLRLAPRRGRYGEVPKPESAAYPISSVAGSKGSATNAALTNGSAKGGVAARILTDQKITASHPRVQTEQYVLEPIPDRYACESMPTLYLRQDLSLWIRHRGFGIGANLYSMSLLPEEEQTITIKSFKDTKYKTSESSAENIFEEQTDESAQDFANELKNESERDSSSKSDFHVSGEASASFGFGSASIESGYSSASDSRSVAKAASSTLNRCAAKLSAKRAVTVETKRTREEEVTETSELVTERKVRNANKGHTLTFHWFQMTRKLATELRLDDLRLVYTSGLHSRIAVFGNGRRPSDVSEQEFRYLPNDIGCKLPPDTSIVVCEPPYTVAVPMANANAFLAQVFNDETAADISAYLWRIIGSDDNAPEGLAIAAHCGPTLKGFDAAGPWFQVTRPLNADIYDPGSKTPGSVPADTIHTNKNFYLPNIDLRYKTEDGMAPARYSADEFDAYSLPRTLLRQEQVINTNGIYCDAMIGQCSALESFLERHRDLDLLEKRIAVGGKELEFRWELARNGMVDLVVGMENTIVGIVNEAERGKGFAKRLEIEDAKRLEERAIYALELERQRLEAELAILTGKAGQIGNPAKYSIAVPTGANLKVNANIDMGKDDEGESTNLEVKDT